MHRPAYLTDKVLRHADEIKRRKELWQKGREQPLQVRASKGIFNRKPFCTLQGSSDKSEQGAAEKWAEVVDSLPGDEQKRDRFRHLIGMKSDTENGKQESGVTETMSAQRRSVR